MSIIRPTRHGRTALVGTLALLGSLPVMAAQASLRDTRVALPPTAYAAGVADPDRTGSIPADPLPALRSSVLGNAEAPEREPIAQRLGNTSGGGLR